MHSILPKQLSSTFQALLLQKERLKSELTNATYQAFADRSRIEDGLDEISTMKFQIEKQIKFLKDNLVVKMAKVDKAQAEKSYTLQELRLLDVQTLKQQRRMQTIVGSSLVQNQANKKLSQSLSVLQQQNDIGDKQSKKLNNKIVDANRNIQIRLENIKSLRSKTKQNILLLGDVQNKTKVIRDKILGITFKVEQSTATIDKLKQDTSKINQYNNKMKTASQVQKEFSDKEKALIQLQRTLSNAEIEFQDKVFRNRRNLTENQTLQAQNYRFFQQNKGLALQQASDRQVLGYLQSMNTKLRAFLNQKQIINRQTQSVLILPRANQIGTSKIEDAGKKSLGSTGASFS